MFPTSGSVANFKNHNINTTQVAKFNYPPSHYTFLSTGSTPKTKQSFNTITNHSNTVIPPFFKHSTGNPSNTGAFPAFISFTTPNFLYQWRYGGKCDCSNILQVKTIQLFVFNLFSAFVILFHLCYFKYQQIFYLFINGHVQNNPTQSCSSGLRASSIHVAHNRDEVEI